MVVLESYNSTLFNAQLGRLNFKNPSKVEFQVGHEKCSNNYSTLV